MIEAGLEFLMIKISTIDGFSFYEEHQKLIDKNGYVWFCRFGKCNLLISSITKNGNLIFVRDTIKNGGKKYALYFSEVSSTIPDNNYPDYYKTINKEKPLWFKVTSIVELPDNLNSYLCVASSGNSLDHVYKSMCTSFYVKTIKACDFKKSAHDL